MREEVGSRIKELRLGRNMTLKELGEALNPAVGKSGVNHRLRKLSAMAEDLRQNEEDYYVKEMRKSGVTIRTGGQTGSDAGSDREPV